MIKIRAKHFFSGENCIRHENPPRYISSRGCVLCSRMKDKRHYLKSRTPEEIQAERDKANERSELNKIAVINVLTNGEGTCRWCGQGDIDVLNIDHIDGGGNKHRKELGTRNGQSFYTWIISNDYPDGFQVLCANCNLKKEVMRRRNARKVAR